MTNLTNLELGNFTLEDFTETHERVTMQFREMRLVPVHVLCAFGTSNNEGGTEWEGAFLYAVEATVNGWLVLRYIDVRGWNDNTGWGCMDGIRAYMYVPDHDYKHHEAPCACWENPLPARGWSPNRDMFSEVSHVPAWIVCNPPDLNRYCLTLQPVSDDDDRVRRATPALAQARQLVRDMVISDKETMR